MPHALVLDTLAYAKKLKSVGFTEEQAEVQAETLAQLVDEKLTTKQDLKELEVSLKRDMKEIEASLKRDIKELEMRLTIRLGVMIAASIAIVATLIKLL